MNAHAMKIRLLCAIGAIAIVGLAIAVLGGYSNAKYENALAAAHGPDTAPLLQLTLEPSRVDVVATRALRTRTAVTVSNVPGPQS